MKSNKKAWLNECDCLDCLGEFIRKDVGDINIHVECNEKKNDTHHDNSNKKHKDECKDKCQGPTDKVEFQSDTSFLSDEIFNAPIQVLDVTFTKICAGDRVWFSGIVGFDNDTDGEVAVLRLSIVRTPENGNASTIYRQTFEIDEPGDDDRTQVPFAHVEFEQNEAKNVTYTVFVERLNDDIDVFFFGQNTLAALRIH